MTKLDLRDRLWSILDSQLFPSSNLTQYSLMICFNSQFQFLGKQPTTNMELLTLGGIGKLTFYLFFINFNDLD